MTCDDEALKRLCDPVAEVSCHYFIQQDGTVLQLVKDEDVAWHAGVSQWQNFNGLNATSLGIELSNAGHQAYTEEQYQALISLLHVLVESYNIPPKCILAHSDVSPGRKDDPGLLFNWGRLYNEGIAAPLAPKCASLSDLRAAGYVGTDEDIVNAHKLRYSYDEHTNTHTSTSS